MKSKATLETILNHRSIRKFSQEPISEEIFTTLIQAGQRGSTTNNLQCVSVIRVTNPKMREGIRAASGMSYVTECAEFVVFCIDFTKHKALVPEVQLDWTEVTLLGAVDTGIFAQNVLLAAESLGLGGVFIGAIRNNIQAVSNILNLPNHCIPLLGMYLGYPAEDPDLKPRLPLSLICAKNQLPAADKMELAKYNAELIAYYTARSGEPQVWEDALNKTLNKAVRQHIQPYFQQQGFLKR